VENLESRNNSYHYTVMTDQWAILAMSWFIYCWAYANGSLFSYFHSLNRISHIAIAFCMRWQQKCFNYSNNNVGFLLSLFISVRKFSDEAIFLIWYLVSHHQTILQTKVVLKKKNYRSKNQVTKISCIKVQKVYSTQWRKEEITQVT